MSLIFRIVEEWDWCRMKPPICTKDADGNILIVDGQHTAIVAASHPDIKQIPVMLIQTDQVSDRAKSFVGHNRDRVAMTPLQIHVAALAAGDDVAAAIDESCKRVGVTVLRMPPQNGRFKEKQTMSIGALTSVVNKKGSNGLARILKILVDAERVPIRAEEIKAVFSHLYDPDYKGTIKDAELADLIRSKAFISWRVQATSQVTKGLKMPMAKALAILWLRLLPKRSSG
jgi:hypothetical protein